MPSRGSAGLRHPLRRSTDGVVDHGRENQAAEKQRQLELALEQARFEAARARRQYDAVDPDNRRVASELERRWNAALGAVEKPENDLDAMVRQRPAALSPEEDQRLLQMGADLKNRRGQTRWTVEPETLDLIRACARLMPDKAIARMLNRTGKRTGRLNGWTQSRVGDTDIGSSRAPRLHATQRG